MTTAAYQAAFPTITNPIVRTTRLKSVPGWVVREYADGTYDAADTTGPGLSPVLDSFAEAREWALDDDGFDAPSDWDSGSVTFDPYI